MIDQLIIGDKASFDDFGASVASRKIKMPAKKKIKETVPFSNITYDFSAINGEVYWEERELEYTFELVADTPEELEEMKSKFFGWLSDIQEQELHDPHIPFYHFLATYDDASLEDEEDVEKTTITVTFTAYPYMIANDPKVYERTVSGTVENLTILNESKHPVPVTVSTNKPISLTVGTTTYVLGAGTITYESVKLPPGLVTIQLKSTGTDSTGQSTVRVSFREEVF